MVIIGTNNLNDPVTIISNFDKIFVCCSMITVAVKVIVIGCIGSAQRSIPKCVNLFVIVLTPLAYSPAESEFWEGLELSVAAV